MFVVQRIAAAFENYISDMADLLLPQLPQKALIRRRAEMMRTLFAPAQFAGDALRARQMAQIGRFDMNNLKCSRHDFANGLAMIAGTAPLAQPGVRHAAIEEGAPQIK